MKKIISLIAILALVAVIFTLAACGDKTNNDMMTTLKDEGSSMMDEGADMMDDMSEALGDLGDDLTEGGNVTDQNSSTGLLDDMTSDKNESTTAKPSAEGSTSAAGNNGESATMSTGMAE